MSNDYKNIIELKDSVDEATASFIKELCLKVYNKPAERTKIIEHSIRKFDIVTNEEGRVNLLAGVGLMPDYKIFTDNVKSWYWEEPNKFECGDILACMYEEGVLSPELNKKAI